MRLRETSLAVAAELRRRADAIEAEAHRRAESMRHQAAALESVTGELDEAGLDIGPKSDTVQPDMHVESAGAKRSAGQFTDEQKKHPFVAMLAKRHLTVGDVAEAIGVKRTSLQAWYKPFGAEGHRAIPEDAARAIRDKYGVPMGAWTRIKRPK